MRAGALLGADSVLASLDCIASAATVAVEQRGCPRPDRGGSAERAAGRAIAEEFIKFYTSTLKANKKLD